MVYRGKIQLFVARSHGPLKQGDAAAIYVPLYHDKPGRRISVRAVSEFVEMVRRGVGLRGACRTCNTDWNLETIGDVRACPDCNSPLERTDDLVQRFTYIGDTVPQ